MILPKSMGDMRLRDMRAFNQALLAKQASRLIEHPESLVARLLSAKCWGWTATMRYTNSPHGIYAHYTAPSTCDEL